MDVHYDKTFSFYQEFDLDLGDLAAIMYPYIHFLKL
jgi:hypothetical protein